MLRSEGAYTLNLRLDSPIGGGLDAEPAIGLSDQKDSIQKRAH